MLLPQPPFQVKPIALASFLTGRTSARLERTAGFGVHVPEHAILVAGIKGSVRGLIETSVFDHFAQSARLEAVGLLKLVTSRTVF